LRDLLQVAQLKAKDFLLSFQWGMKKKLCQDNICSDLVLIFSYTASNLFYVHSWKEI